MSPRAGGASGSRPNAHHTTINRSSHEVVGPPKRFCARSSRTRHPLARRWITLGQSSAARTSQPCTSGHVWRGCTTLEYHGRPHEIAPNEDYLLVLIDQLTLRGASEKRANFTISGLSRLPPKSSWHASSIFCRNPRLFETRASRCNGDHEIRELGR